MTNKEKMEKVANAACESADADVLEFANELNQTDPLIRARKLFAWAVIELHPEVSNDEIREHMGGNEEMPISKFGDGFIPDRDLTTVTKQFRDVVLACRENWEQGTTTAVETTIEVGDPEGKGTSVVHEHCESQEEEAHS